MLKRRRRVYAVKPYLLPECPLEYARGLYQGEGTFSCVVLRKKKAYPEIAITMGDADALKPLEPCFGTKITPHRGYFRLQRFGRAALQIANQLATTPKRQQQIDEAMQRCRKKWKKGYTNQILE